MRVVFTLRCPVPELVDLVARSGAHVTVRLDDEEAPVSVTAHLGPEALEVLTRHASSLRLAASSPECQQAAEVLAHLLASVLGLAPRVRLME